MSEYVLRPNKTSGDQYWFARNPDGSIYTGKTEVGLVTRSGAVEFEYGEAATVATKLDKYKDKLAVEKTTEQKTEDPTEDMFVLDKDGNIKCTDTAISDGSQIDLQK